MCAATDTRPSVEDGIRNQLQGNCGGTGWRLLGGECLGWWEQCKGCDECKGTKG